jgi:poly(3-hydroxybutyrate) depolymerase
LLYYLYEMNHAVMGPARALADVGRMVFRNPMNPLAFTFGGKAMAASFDVFERMTRRYDKPEFGIASVEIKGKDVAVSEQIVWEKPFCKLLHFSKDNGIGEKQPKLLIVAPMSGHYATLLRGTVETMLQDHDVYITDWVDARMVPLDAGRFDLDDYIDYITEIFDFLGTGANVMAVCQPSVPVLAAVALMEAEGNPNVPATMTLMGGPVDTRINATEVNKLAESRSIDWFRNNVIMRVPFPNPGVMREVYPGFLQLSGFMSMNLDRHMTAHSDFFQHLVAGDGDSADKHEAFYDEYLAVMDLTAEYYLQTVETVFIRHDLPKGSFRHRGRIVDPAAIKRVALFTIEGEFDDISGLGQTEAAHKICSNIPKPMHQHYVQPDVGHYGVFNGSRFRREIAPRITKFVEKHKKPAARVKATAGAI